MNDVRLRFAGMFGLLVRFLSLFTGLVFTTIVTRNLTVDEFGQWSIISSLLVYGIYIPSILPFWYTRYTARGVTIAKTSIISTLLISFLGILIYLIAGKIFLPEFEKFFPILIFATFQVISTSLIISLSSIANGIKPEYTSYGFIIFEITKVIIAIILVYLLGVDLLTVILITIVAEIVHVGVLAILIRKEIRKKTDFKNIIKIFKVSWLALYTKIGGLIFLTDVLVANFLNLSYEFIAIFKIGFIFAVIAEYGSYIAYPLYIKLLRGGKSEDIQVSTKLMFTFSIPISIGIFLLSKPLLFLLNPEYIIAEKIVQILIAYYFSSTIIALFFNIAQGMDTVDIKPNIRFKDFLHSALFKFPTLNIIRMSMYIAGLIVLIFVTDPLNLSPEKFGEYWAAVLLITNLPIIIYSVRLTKKVVDFSFPLKNIGKYVIASSIMGIFIWYSTSLLEFNSHVMIFAPQLLMIILPSGLLYFGILFFIDKDTKHLINDTISFIRNK